MFRKDVWVQVWDMYKAPIVIIGAVICIILWLAVWFGIVALAQVHINSTGAWVSFGAYPVISVIMFMYVNANAELNKRARNALTREN